MKSQPKAVILPLNELEFSSALQVRVRLDQKKIAEYTEDIAEGAIMPPLVVFAEKGSHRYLVADGFHRGPAFKANGIEEVACEQHEGGLREALRYALGANDTHGLRRNSKDKRHAVMMALKDPEWCRWSNTDIARVCRVSDYLVATVRDELVLAGEIDEPDTVTTIRHGKEVERKAGRASSEKSDEPKSSTKSTSTPPPKRPKPKTQDQKDREEYDAALTAINSQVHDGREKARRWYSIDRKKQTLLAIVWLQEFVAACEDIEKKDAA